MRRPLVILVIALMSLNGTAFAQTINVDNAKSIELKQVQKKIRVVALANGSAEVIAALGYKSSIVGRDIASTTTELKSIPIVTSGHQVIAEKVISLKPDVVIIDSTVGPKSSIDAIKAAKKKVVSINDAWNLSDIYKKVSQVSAILNDKSAGQTLIKNMQLAVTNANKNIGWKPKVAFLYLRGPSAIYLIGGPGSGADSLITALGAVDVGAKSLKNPFNTLTSEALVAANPDVILLMTKGLQSVGGESGLLKLPGVAQTNAGKNKKFLTVDDSLLLSFGPRTPDLIGKLATGFKALK